MGEEHVSLNMREIFIRCTHINYYIIACLRAKKVLDKFQVSQISGEASLIKRSKMVLEWIENNRSLRDIVRQVMEENGQEHVSNLLKGIKNGPHIPLSQWRYTRLESITQLMLIIRNDEELIAKLRAMGAISEIDRQDITQENKEYKRNWNLIEAILRRSDYAFDCFGRALRDTLQDHVANYLHEGQVIAVHVNTNDPEKDEDLSELLNKTILEESKDDPSSEEKILAPINGFNIHPVVTKPGQSIVFFFYCKTVDNMIIFTELFISGDLQDMIEVIMNRLLLTIDHGNIEKSKARLSLDDSEILAVEKFSGIADWMPIELKETTPVSRILYSAGTQTEDQHGDRDSYDKDWKAAKIDKIPSLPMSSSSVVTQIPADDSSGLGHNKACLDRIQKLEQRIKEMESIIKQYHRKTGKHPEKYQMFPRLMHTINFEATARKIKSIVGMTLLDKELFVVSWKSSEVEVYDSIKFIFSRRWKLKELIDPRDITSCNKNKCHYMFDPKGFLSQSSEILRVDPNGKLIKKWSAVNDYGRLSVTCQSNIILNVYGNNELIEFTPEGCVVRTIGLSLEAGIYCPWHVIKLTNGYFVVSHGYANSDLHRVCIVDSYGDIKKTFGGKSGSTIGQLNLPVHFSVDGNGFVFVVDRTNHRVLLLDSDLEFKREILSEEKHGLRYPRRILLDEPNGRLFVADNEDSAQRIFILI